MVTLKSGVHIERRGAGPPLLMIQGASATVAMWGEPLLVALARSFDVATYDHPGVGGSSDAPGPFTTADLADVASGLLDDLGWVRADILGVSMGGMVAQQLALRHPERVGRLVLGASRAGADTADGGEPDVIAHVANEAHVPGDPKATARNMFRALVSDAFGSSEAADEVFRATSFPIDPRVATLHLAAARCHDLRRVVCGITAPTLVVHGAEDRVIAPEEGRALAAAIPGARFTELATGHLFWLEEPEETARVVAGFLTG